MGQCYSIILKTKFTDETKAFHALSNKIAEADNDLADYNLDHYREIGVKTNTLYGLLQVVFGGWSGRLERDEKGCLRSDFNACYGWEYIMQRCFETIAPHLKDGSFIKIYPDSGIDIGRVRDGTVVWK